MRLVRDIAITNSQNILPETENIQLNQNYPNPFNPTTKISFNLSSVNNNNTELVIYNLKGQKVKQLLNKNLLDGEHSIIWNGTDENNQPVASGIYYYRLKTDEGMLFSKKMLLLK